MKKHSIAFSLLIIHSFWMFILAFTLGHRATLMYSNWLLMFPIILIIIAIVLIIPKQDKVLDIPKPNEDDSFDSLSIKKSVCFTPRGKALAARLQARATPQERKLTDFYYAKLFHR